MENGLSQTVESVSKLMKKHLLNNNDFLSDDLRKHLLILFQNESNHSVENKTDKLELKLKNYFLECNMEQKLFAKIQCFILDIENA